MRLKCSFWRRVWMHEDSRMESAMMILSVLKPEGRPSPARLDSSFIFLQHVGCGATFHFKLMNSEYRWPLTMKTTENEQ